MNIAVQGLRLDGANWVFSYRSAGRAKRMTIGKFPAVTAKDAAKGASILAGQVCCGRCPASERRASRRRDIAAAAPVRDHVERVARAYLKHAKTRTRASTFAETMRVFRVEILPKWKGKRLGEISKVDVRTLIEGIAKRPAPISANRCLATVKTFFAFAVEQDILTVNCSTAIKPPAVETPRERCLDDVELGAVWRASQELGEYGAIVRLLILTGARRSEVSELCWSEIDIIGRTWTLPAARAKNGRQHTIPLSEQALTILGSLQIGIGPTPLFEPQSHSRMKGLLDKLLPGMEPWTVHDLRRTAASGMAGLGVQPHVVEAVLNHRSGVIRGVASVYNRYSYSTEKREALSLWGEYVAGLVSLSKAA